MFTRGRLRAELRRPVLRLLAPVALAAFLAAGCAGAGSTAATAAKPGAASTAAGVVSPSKDHRTRAQPRSWPTSRR